MRILFLTISILFVFSIKLQAQFDTNYVHINKERFSAYPIFEFYKTSYRVKFAEKDLDNPIYEEIEQNYHTKNSLYLGVGMSFYRFGFALSFRLPHSDIEELKGSKAIAFTGGYSYGKFYGEMRWKVYKGVEKEHINYLEDTTLINSSIDQHVDSRQTGLMLYYFSSGKYNFDANFKNYNIQKKSAISFALGGGVNHYYVNGDIDYGDSLKQTKPRSIRVYSAKIIPGVVGTLCYKNFYLSLFSLLGPSYNYNIMDKTTVRHKLAPAFEFRTALGYNNKNFFSSFTFLYDNDLISMKEHKLSVKNFMFNVKLGFKIPSRHLGKAAQFL